MALYGIWDHFTTSFNSDSSLLLPYSYPLPKLLPMLKTTYVLQLTFPESLTSNHDF